MRIRQTTRAAVGRAANPASDSVDQLLEGMRGADAHGAWRTFYELHGGMILRYSRRRGLNAHDAEDVLQDTVVTLLRLFPTFQHDPARGKFVNFVLTVAHRKILAVVRRASRRYEVALGAGEEHRLTRETDEIPTSATAAITEGQLALAAEALRRVQSCPRTSARTFAVFEAYALQRQPVGCVARRFSLKENAVYQIRNRLLRRMQAEIRSLKAETRAWDRQDFLARPRLNPGRQPAMQSDPGQ